MRPHCGQSLKHLLRVLHATPARPYLLPQPLLQCLPLLPSQ
jgi:hypothetical protein